MGQPQSLTYSTFLGKSWTEAAWLKPGWAKTFRLGFSTGIWLPLAQLLKRRVIASFMPLMILLAFFPSDIRSIWIAVPGLLAHSYFLTQNL